MFFLRSVECFGVNKAAPLEFEMKAKHLKTGIIQDL